MKSHQLIRIAHTLMAVDFMGAQIRDFGKIEFCGFYFADFNKQNNGAYQ